MPFSSLYADVQLCVLRFLTVRELVTMVRVCKFVATAASKLQPSDVPPFELRARSTLDNGCEYASPLLSSPRSVLRHLVTRLDLLCAAEDFPMVCAPYTLRHCCPELRELRLELFRLLAAPFDCSPTLRAFDLWPPKLKWLHLEWTDVFTRGDALEVDEMAEQLRALCTVAGSIPTLTSLSISARRTVLEDGEDGIPVPTPFLPILSPLLSLTRLGRLEISIGDYTHSDTHSGWVSDEDCAVICQLPSLTDLSVNEGKWRREGLLEHITHSDEAAEFRARVTRLDVRDYALDADTKRAFRELQLACPLIAATLQN